ncbi:protein LURP-one-related 8-like [Dorcoceras hygrometricum]|uniref:Protein LURP-one-related 8-like n=1 Tax=Dorcoceras hygrometricum TaxID=472368 RepID=A0A2Z7AXI3_9LAMI|nr:protein LURP-one-related 8-like [Dorcoceras hygrometricum]
MSVCLDDPRRRGRATTQIPTESEGQNEEIQRSVAKRRCLEETRFEMRKLLALCEPAWFEGLLWTDFGLSRPEGSAMSFWLLANADSDWSKSGSAGLHLPRCFFLYLFRRLELSWKKIAKEATLCSLLSFWQICFFVQDACFEDERQYHAPHLPTGFCKPL